MKISKNEILKRVSSSNICDDLTFSGLEVEECLPVAGEFSNVVVGEIVSIAAHPDAERLKVCAVNVGQETIQVVTNLQTVYVGLRLPVALVDAVLDDGMVIKPTKLRGVESNGMFCSCESLGIKDSTLDILSFSDEVAPGTNVRVALDLDDEIIDIAITPNRGDCLGYSGIARQLAAYTQQAYTAPSAPDIAITSDSSVDINIDQALAPVFAARKIDGINPKIATPLSMVEFLRRSGLRSVNFVVDCLNTVMLECGAPMHAYAADKISGALQVRMAKSGEHIALLNDSEIKLDADDLVVADDNGPQALAGVMGGAASGVADDTSSVILEAAYFPPGLISKAVRKHKLSSDSAYRFERGADWNLCEFALDLAAKLITDVAGGQVGPINCTKSQDLQLQQINLRYAQVARVLGQDIPTEQIHNILQAVGCEITAREDEHCTILAPSYRSDLVQECDLIEEILIISGVNNLPAAELKGSLRVNQGVNEASCCKWQPLYNIFANLGFNEALTYSFISASDYADFAPIETALRLENPISQDLSVMRPSLLPGLLRALEFNINHQRDRAQLFEMGQCFSTNDSHEELSGIIYGSKLPASWSVENKDFDLYDCKQYVMESLRSIGLNSLQVSALDTAAAQSSLWHPGLSLEVRYEDAIIARIGQLHPALEQSYNVKKPALMFSIYLDNIEISHKNKFITYSEQPAIRRDIALIVKASLESRKITEKILEISGDLLDNINVFDVYQGQGVESDCKSVGLNLTFRAYDRTLVEEEINNIMQQILAALDSEFGAKLRM